MIEKYEIRKLEEEERLFLYLNIDTEFGKLGFRNKKKKLEDVIKEYLIRNNIEFKGKVISIIIGGMFVGNIILNNSFYNVDNKNDVHYVSNKIVEMLNNNEILDSNRLNDIKKESVEVIKDENVNKEKKKEKKTVTKKNVVKKENNSKSSNVSKNIDNKNIISEDKQDKNDKEEVKESINTFDDKKEEVKEDETDNNIYISLIRNGSTEKIELEEYVVGVVGAEMPASFHIEALRSQAIIARTYALKALSKGKSLKSNESNQSYKTVNELKSMWGSNFNTYYNKVREAVSSTKGKYLSYNGNYIEAVYHSTSNGKTESSANVWGNFYPYLVSVSSTYDNLNPSFVGNKTFSYQELSKILGIDVNKDTLFVVNSKTSGDRVASITIGDKNYTGVVLRNLLGLRSADFDTTLNDDNIIFTTKGYGHGVGLSQYGANGYAKNGYSYSKILLHYYPGVKISSL